ncbi:MAG TPA: prohibitin family protein [Ignavibacteriaceae bacterium]|nr:prohibitin family protein [Ignavibacteriaceae bacterium]
MLFIIAILAAVVAAIVYYNAKKRFSKSESTFALAGLVVAAFIALMQFWTVIPAGHAGVVDFLGYVSENTLKSGVNLVNPMANVIKFDTRKQELKEVMTVPSKEGLSVDLEISLIFQLSKEKVNQIYNSTGDFDEYLQKLILPNFRSVVRGVTTKYEAKSLYTADREKLEFEIEQNLRSVKELSEVIILSTPLRKVSLPPGLTASIEEKLKAEQESQRMQFVLQRETQEADRKRIEAKGIADFQDIVSKGISEQLLKWKGIEATEKLANSPNSKIVVIGSGKQGLPLILGGD